MRVCVCVCVCVRARAHIHIYVHKIMYINICVCHIHTRIHACIHTYIRTYIHTCIHTCIRTCKHAYMIFIYFFIQASSRTWHDSWPARTSTGKLTPSPLQQPFQHKKTLTEYRDHRPHIHLYTYIYILPGTEVTSYTFIYTYNMYYRVPRSQATHSLSSFKSR
jgi:hypothetical protein